jgi:hypothetical protein
VDAVHRVVEWRLHQPGRHGLQNFRFGDVTTDFIADGDGHVQIKSNKAYTLILNGKSLKVKAGDQSFSL